MDVPRLHRLAGVDQDALNSFGDQAAPQSATLARGEAKGRLEGRAQREWIEISAVGPDDSAEFVVPPHLCEEVRVAQRPEDGAM
jgi:hypothetical protein